MPVQQVASRSKGQVHTKVLVHAPPRRIRIKKLLRYVKPRGRNPVLKKICIFLGILVHDLDPLWRSQITQTTGCNSVISRTYGLPLPVEMQKCTLLHPEFHNILESRHLGSCLLTLLLRPFASRVSIQDEKIRYLPS